MIHKVDLTGDYETTIYDAARRALAKGANPSDTVEIWRSGKFSMSGVVGWLAKRRVVFASSGLRLTPHTGCTPGKHGHSQFRFPGGLFSVVFALIVVVGTILKYPTHYSGNCLVAAI